jgi:hypothetical protein
MTPSNRSSRSCRHWRGFSSFAALILAGCGADYADDAPLRKKNEDLSTSVVPNDFQTAGTLGQGRDSITEEFRADCVRSPTAVHIPLAESNLRFRTSLQKEDASELLGFSVDAKARFKLISGSARARFSRSLTNNSLSIGMFYVGDYRLGVERIDQANLQWLVQPGAPDWLTRCGDQLLLQRERGGQLFLVYRIDFSSAEAKQEFEGAVGISVPAGDINSAVNRASSRFEGRASVHVEALQVGGDPTRLSSILGAGGPDANAGRIITECSLTNLAPCGQFMQNAINYASAQTPGSFSEDLRVAPADRTYLFEDWSLLGVSIPKRRVPAAVKTARVTLRRLFDGQVEFADRVSVLQNGSIFVHAELRDQLDDYAQAVRENLAILSDGAALCFDELSDPSDPHQVEDCTAFSDTLDSQGYDRTLTVDKLTVPPPSLGNRVAERTDPTGKITVAVFERQADVSAGQFHDFPVSVDPGYVVIGGGAEASHLPLGNLLTASYPGADGWSWFVSSKDHLVADSIKVKAYAIGMKVAGLSRDELKNVLTVRSSTSTVAQSPEATVAVPSDYALLGGGFLVDSKGVGNLATASYPLPDGQTWRAKSKSLGAVDASPIKAYAIGIQRSVPGLGNVTTSIQSAVSSVQAHPSTFVQPAPGSVLVGCGASAVVTVPPTSCFRGGCLGDLGQGQLLWKLKPDTTLAACDVGSKDHKFASPGTITGYALGIAVK